MRQIFHLGPNLIRRAIIKNATKILLGLIALTWISIRQISILSRWKIRVFLYRSRTVLANQTASKNNRMKCLTSMQLWILEATAPQIFMWIIRKLTLWVLSNGSISKTMPAREELTHQDLAIFKMATPAQ